MRNKLDQELLSEIQAIRDSGMYKSEAPLSSPQGAEILIGGKKYINFGTNNYLGLANSPELVAVAGEALNKYGYGYASVRFISGTSENHKTLESMVANFFGFEDSLLYSSCFDANTGLFDALMREDDVILSDELNHASIIDGIRLSRAMCLRYKHNDIQDLGAKLSEITNRESKRIMIVSDGVFSMDGEVAHLKDICDLADKFDAITMIDDSHGTGVLGKSGRGSIEFSDVTGRVDILTSTFGKALGGAGGGFTTASKSIIEFLRQRSRPYIFSNSIPPTIVACAIHVLTNFDSKYIALTKKLADNTTYFRELLSKQGYSVGGNKVHPIVPIMIGDEQKTIKLAESLLSQGIYLRGFTYPVVPIGKARIRVQISALHTKEHLDKALDTLCQMY